MPSSAQTPFDGDVDDRVGQVGAGGEVAKAPGVLAPPDRVDGVADDAAVTGIADAGQGEERLPPRHGVAVEHDLLGRLQRSPAAAMQRVLAPLDVPRVGPPATRKDGRRGVVLLEAAGDLLEEHGLQRVRRRHHLGEVGVLGLEVGDHRGVLALAQPEVLIRADGAVLVELVRDLRRHRRRRGAHAGGQPEDQPSQHHTTQDAHRDSPAGRSVQSGTCQSILVSAAVASRCR